jgi:hypothetical protein
MPQLLLEEIIGNYVLVGDDGLCGREVNVVRRAKSNGLRQLPTMLC